MGSKLLPGDALVSCGACCEMSLFLSPLTRQALVYGRFAQPTKQTKNPVSVDVGCADGEGSKWSWCVHIAGSQKTMTIHSTAMVIYSFRHGGLYNVKYYKMWLVLEDDSYGSLPETPKRSARAAWCVLSRVVTSGSSTLQYGILHFVLMPGFTSPWDPLTESWREHELAKCSVAGFVILLHLFCTIRSSTEPPSQQFFNDNSVICDHQLSYTNGRRMTIFLLWTPQGCVYSAGSRTVQQTIHFSRVSCLVFITIYKCLPALRKMFWSLIKMQFENITHLHCTRTR